MVKTNIIESQRKKLKISKRQLAKDIGISRQAYYDIIANKSTRTETLDKIADLLGLNVKDLLK
jgi:DNA-binding XRE family transcriptional regulator